MTHEAYVEVTVSTFEVCTAGDRLSFPLAGVETAGGAPSTPGCRGATGFFTWVLT